MQPPVVGERRRRDGRAAHQDLPVGGDLHAVQNSGGAPAPACAALALRSTSDASGAVATWEHASVRP